MVDKLTIPGFKDRLELLIKELSGGNKAQFSGMLGITPVNIQGWLNRGSLPSSAQLLNIANKTNVNLNWLLTGEGEKHIAEKTPVVADDEESYEPTDKPIGIEVPEVLHNFNRLNDLDKRRVIHSIIACLKEAGMQYEKLFKE